MNYVLDSNSWIDHFRRGPNSKVTAKLVTLPQGSVFLCSIVLGELMYGAHHGGPIHLANNLALIATIRRRFASIPFDDSAAEEYGRIREYLATQGTPIGPNDLLIAALALAKHLVLVTRNTMEFSRVPGLVLEDWQ